MDVNEILNNINEILLDIEDDGFDVLREPPLLTFSKLYTEYEFFISYKMIFTIDKIDKTLFRIKNFLDSHIIPHIFYISICGDDNGRYGKKIYLYNDDRYIRAEGVKLKDWNLIKSCTLSFMIKNV
jgi:hypothetical protein